MGRLERNSAAVQRYLVEVLPKIDRSMTMSEEPPDRKRKGESRPPLSERAWKLIEANREASALIRPVFDEAMRHDLSHAGHHLSTLLREAWGDHDAFKRWKNGVGEDKGKSPALWKLSMLLARAIDADAVRRGERNLELFVTTLPEIDEEESPDPRKDPPGPARSHTAHDSYRIIVEKLEALERELTPITRKAAMEELDKRERERSGWGYSVPRIEKAIRFVNLEREAKAGNGDAA